MKKSAATMVLLLGVVFGFTPSAQAGELSTNGATVSWDDATFYYPSGCSQFRLNYSLAPSVLIVDIAVTNKFGDNVGSTLILGSGTQGSKTLQICRSSATPQLAPFTMSMEVQQSHSSGDGSTSVVSSPLVFLSRDGAVTPTPTPTPTATSAPIASPTPTQTKIFVCVNKKNFSVKRAPSSKKCSKGWVLKSFK
jgi:hypothetical protein